MTKRDFEIIANSVTGQEDMTSEETLNANMAKIAAALGAKNGARKADVTVRVVSDAARKRVTP